MIDRGRYLLGDCAALALALHQITGWQIVVITSPCHALVRMPDGRLLDASGPHPAGCLDGFPHREAGAEELAARFGLTSTPAEVMADARELLDSAGAMPPGPFPWRSRTFWESVTPGRYNQHGTSAEELRSDRPAVR